MCGLSRTAGGIVLVSGALAFIPSRIVSGGQQTTSPLPSSELSFGAFTARLVPDGTFTLEGEGWPAVKGIWKADSGQISRRQVTGIRHIAAIAAAPQEVALFLPFACNKEQQTAASSGTKRRAEIAGLDE